MTVSRFGFAFVGLMITATVCLAQPVQSRPGVAPEDDDPRRIVADPTVAVDQGGPWWLSLTVFQGYDGKGYSTDPNDANGGTLLTLYGPNTGGTIRGSVAKGGTRGGITADVGTSLIY